MVNADDKSQEPNNDRNAANRDLIQTQNAEPRRPLTEEQTSAGNFSDQVRQARIDRRLMKTKLYSADTVNEELAQSAMANADRTGPKQEEQHGQLPGEMKDIVAAGDISNQVRQARINRQLKKTRLYSSDNAQNSTEGITSRTVPSAAFPNTINPNPAVPNSASPNSAFPIPAIPAIPSPTFPSEAVPNTALQHPKQEEHQAELSGFDNGVESESEPTKIQARPRQKARPESRGGQTSPADFQVEDQGTKNRNRRESPQDFQTDAPNKRGLVVSLMVLVLLVTAGAFVLNSQFHSKGNVNAHEQQAPPKASASSKPAGPRYYTGLQVSFDPDQVPMTVENMQEYNSTKISDNVCLLVASVLPNSPAGKAGLHLGERVAAIDGQNINGLTIQQAQAMLEGESNSTVKISVRYGLQAERTLALLRLVPVNPAPAGKGKKK